MNVWECLSNQLIFCRINSSYNIEPQMTCLYAGESKHCRAAGITWYDVRWSRCRCSENGNHGAPRLSVVLLLHFSSKPHTCAVVCKWLVLEMLTLTISLEGSRIYALNMTSQFGNQTSQFHVHQKIIFIHKRVYLFYAL